MLKQLIPSSLIGGVIVFVWVMISWMVLPFHEMTIGQFGDSQAVSKVVLEQTEKDGIYVFPKMGEGQLVEGPQPFGFINVSREVDFNNMGSSFLLGLFTQFIGAFVITWMLLKTKMTKFWDRVCFVTMAGFLVAVLGMMPFYNWWFFPGNFVLVGMFDYVISWFLAGLAIAYLTKK